MLAYEIMLPEKSARIVFDAKKWEDTIPFLEGKTFFESMIGWSYCL